MGMFEPKDVKVGDELMIIIEAVAPTQEQASTIWFARSTMLHFGYEGRIATAGNLLSLSLHRIVKWAKYMSLVYIIY